ncbi:MAG: hypothetical protein WAU45_18030 [Blastocatellia bacterium]
MHNNRFYVDKLLELYLGLPDTPSRISRYDRQLAYKLYQQNVALEIVEAAFLLGSARRIFRDPTYPALGPIRSLHYFLPLIQEVIATQPPKDYLRYLRHKLVNYTAQKPTSK